MAGAEALTFEKVWEMFQETREQMKENALQMKEDHERRMKEYDRRKEESDRQMKELKEQLKETDRIVGDLGNRFGELAEHLVAPNIKEKFNELGFTFERIYQNLAITDFSSGRCLAEIDLMLENGDIVIAVEVKAKPIQKDIDKHIERIEVLRRRADARNDTRKFQGAIAGAIMIDEVRDYTLQAGFYVIEQTGDTVKINIPKDFKPREW
jgi:hypothetical protein